MATQAAVRDSGPRSARRGRDGNGAQSYGGRQQSRVNGAEKQGDERLANFLGWFSIGIGLAQIVAPGGVARLIGVDDDNESRKVMRTVGVRELTAGVGILSRPRPAGWVWSRVAGDMMDLALLGKAMSSDDNDRGRVAAATAAVLGVTALDVLCGTQLRKRADGSTSKAARKAKNNIEIKRAITVNRPLEEVYAFWRDFENLPQFMDHLESVRTISERRSHWKAKAPADVTIEWEAEIIEERPNEIIVWRSLVGADVDNSGSVRFRRAPGDRGTEIILDVEYNPPGGIIGSKLAKLFSEVPKTQMGNDLRRFKQVLETGEVVHSDASIAKGPHPARPPEFPVTV